MNDKTIMIAIQVFQANTKDVVEIEEAISKALEKFANKSVNISIVTPPTVSYGVPPVTPAR